MILARALDNLLLDATSVTITVGTAVAGFGADKLSDFLLARPCKVTAGNLTVVANWSSPVLPELAVLGHSNLNVAARLQGHTADSWATPDIDQVFAVPTVSVDGYFSNPWLDLSQGFAAKAWWRLHIVSNALPVTIGELFLAASARRIESDYHYDDALPASLDGAVVHETNFGVELGYSQAPRRETIDGSVHADAAELATLQGIFDSARGRARSFVMVPRAMTPADAWFVRYAGTRLEKKPLAGGAPYTGGVGVVTQWRVSFPVTQLSRGLAWIDPD